MEALKFGLVELNANFFFQIANLIILFAIIYLFIRVFRFVQLGIKAFTIYIDKNSDKPDSHDKK